MPLALPRMPGLLLWPVLLLRPVLLRRPLLRPVLLCRPLLRPVLVVLVVLLLVMLRPVHLPAVRVVRPGLVRWFGSFHRLVGLGL